MGHCQLSRADSCALSEETILNGFSKNQRPAVGMVMWLGKPHSALPLNGKLGESVFGLSITFLFQGTLIT